MPGAHLQCSTRPEASPDLARSGLGKVRKDPRRPLPDLVGYAALQGTVESDIFDRSANNQQTVRPLQGVDVLMTNDRAARLLRLTVADQMSFDGF